MLNNNIKTLINKIVWWIPFKQKRDSLRSQLIESINNNIEKYEALSKKYEELIQDYIHNIIIHKNIPLNEKFEIETINLFKNKIYLYDYDEINKFVYLIKDNFKLVTDIYNQVIINEVFCDNLYDISKYIDIEKKYVLFDIGCNRGYTSLYFASKEYIKKIYSFEIINNIFKYAEENVRINKDISDKITLYNFGLSNKDEKILAQYYKFADSISGVDRQVDNSREVSYVESYIKNTSNILKKIIETEKIEENLIIKIDTEGSEYKIFESLFCEYPDIFTNIILLIGEFHLGTKDIDKKLENLGFKSFINGREFIFYRPDQTRPDQTRPDQTRPDQTMN